MSSHKTGMTLVMTVISASPPTMTVTRKGTKSGRTLAGWTCCLDECEGPHITPKALVALLLRDGHKMDNPVILAIPPFFFRTKQKG